MPKITLIGAGSVVFAKNLLGDILSFPELAQSQIALLDIDPGRLAVAERMAHRVAHAVGAQPRITATLDRREALSNAKYAINMIQVGGHPSTYTDFDIPEKYGLRQTIADTLGVGGIFRALRTIPVMQDIARDMEQVSDPQSVFLNYVNPMAMNTWAWYRTTKIPVVGLCHSVQGTAEQLARDIGIPIEEINYLCAGINHMAFYLKFERKGEDLYPQIRNVVKKGRIPDDNRVRYEMLQRLGYFVTESSEHFAEYTPYFIKQNHPELLERFHVPLREYLRRCDEMAAGWSRTQAEMLGEDADQTPISVTRSHEYGSGIIHSLETGTPRVVYGNGENLGLIDNLPHGCCVEVPTLADQNGLQPTHVGPLPPQLAALMQTNINVQSLTVEASLTGNREHVYHAAMLDPHTSAELTLDEIWQVVDDLFDAHKDVLPQFNF